MCCCNEKENEIKFIKGDVLEIYFAVEDIELEYISRVVFSCVGAKMLFELPYSEEKEAFCLRFNSQMSDEIKPGFYTYDLTIELEGGSIITLLHDEDFVVLKKKNTLNEEVYAEEEIDGDDSEDEDNVDETEEPADPPEDNDGENGDSSPSSSDDGESLEDSDNQSSSPINGDEEGNGDNE